MQLGTVLIALLVVVGAAAQAQPLLGIAGTFSQSGDYDDVLEALDAVDVHTISLTLYWDDFDQDGTFAPEADWPVIANQVYPAIGISLTLTVPVIDTVADRRPEDLRDLDWDDPQVITRFTAFLDALFARIPDLSLVYLSIGNEVDVYLQGDMWDQYGRFFEAARDHVATRHPGLVIGTSMTWGGLSTLPEARRLADAGDAWLVTWYPLGPGFVVQDADSASATLARMLETAGSSPVYLAEAGYPSGGCNGTEAGQARFVRHLLAADDPRLRLIMLFWLHDLPPDEVARYTTYYGVSDDCFARYLATLGLRSHDGRDKPAFTLLRNR